jgi:hypothetical protein
MAAMSIADLLGSHGPFGTFEDSKLSGLAGIKIQGLARLLASCRKETKHSDQATAFNSIELTHSTALLWQKKLTVDPRFRSPANEYRHASKLSQSSQFTAAEIELLRVFLPPPQTQKSRAARNPNQVLSKHQ